MKSLLICVLFWLGVSVCAQDMFRFPSPAAGVGSFSNYASHNIPTYKNFKDFLNHPVYAQMGEPIGRLNLTFEGQSSYRVYDTGNCTATIISERLLITNAHCVQSPQFSREAGEDIRLTNLSLSMNALEPNDDGDMYIVKVTPVEINHQLDFAIMEFAADSPYQRYGAVDLSQHRSASIGESLYMIHHSFIIEDLTNHKRITETDCTRLSERQIGNHSTMPILMPDGISTRAVGSHDKPHFCDSEVGSSGSLIYARSDNAVVGLHFAGFHATREADRFNLYIDIEVLCRQSRVLQNFCGRQSQEGHLSISSTPSGATVLLNGSSIGTTPLRNYSHEAGNHQLSLRYNGYETHSESLGLRAGQHVQRNITLEPALIRTADELVRRARQGGTLRLAAGTFRLSSTLELSGDVRLVGQGYEQTRIVSSAGEYVVRYTGGGTFAAQGVGFEHTGNAIADVVRVENGTLDIDSCQFTKGKDDGNGNGGLGLWIRGNTRGTVRNSLFNDNDLHGIEVRDNAQPRLEQNRLHDNTQVGISYLGSAGGSAVSNESYGNGYHGIGVTDNAQPRLEQNRLHDNTKSGIAYAGSAGGSAVSNESYGNGSNGIGLQGDAQPRLEQNEAYNNIHGIYVGGNAQPRLEQNRLHDNTQVGISYLGSAGGSAVGNESYNNGLYGIGLQGDAQPRLEQNEAYNNIHGIYVEGNAQPRLEQNRLHDNTQAGIIYLGSAGGSASNNISYNNRGGIVLLGSSSPTLNNNTIYDNSQGNLIDER